MFWRRLIGGEGQEEARKEPAGEAGQSPAVINIEPDAARPATILRVAGELEEGGAEIVELFKELESPLGSAVLPIHLRRGEEEVFIEVQTGAWEQQRIEEFQRSMAVLHASSYSGSRLEMLSAYPIPWGVGYFLGDSPLVPLQLELFGLDASDPAACAGRFVEAVERNVGMELDYTPDGLPLLEELLLSAIREDSGNVPPMSGALANGLGFYLGEVIRRSVSAGGEWSREGEWGEEMVLEVGEFTLDPVGKARVFLEEGEEDSVSYYARYVIGELDHP